DEERIDALRRRAEVRGAELLLSTVPTPEERRVEEALTRGFLSSPDGEGRREGSDAVPFPPPTIEIALVHAPIQDVHQLVLDRPVDVIAVGHYLGVKPQAAEWALDTAISAALIDTDHVAGGVDV